MLFSHGYGQGRNQFCQKNTPPLLAILVSMRRCGCNAVHIDQCSMSTATPEASGCHHRATNHSVLPQQLLGSRAKQWQWRKTHLFCWPFRWQWWCAGTLPHASPNGGGPGFTRNYWRRHQARFCSNSINRTYLHQFSLVFFIVCLLKKATR